MSSFLMIDLLVFATAAIYCLPVLPCMIEVIMKTDVEPLQVVQQHAGDVRYFADGLRRYLASIESDSCGDDISKTVQTGMMPDGVPYISLGSGADKRSIVDRLKGVCGSVVVSRDTLLLPEKSVFEQDIYSQSSLVGGAHNLYRAVLADGDIHLDIDSHVSRWIHAGQQLIAGSGSSLGRRASAGALIELAPNCRFTRLHAPRIDTGAGTVVVMEPEGQFRTGEARTRTIHDSDLVISPNSTIYGDIVVRGKLWVGAGTRLFGNIKCEGDVQLDSGVHIYGSLISERCLSVDVGCVVGGPIVAERRLSARGGTCFGLAQALTTVSAPAIVLEPSVTVFGTLWAREHGRVETCS